MGVIDEILAREGGYVNDPKDLGGPTKYGITIGQLQLVRGRKLTAEDVQALTEQEARQIYADIYVKPFQSVANEQIREFLVDSAVQHGVARARQWLPIALSSDNDELNFLRLFAVRSRYYGDILLKRPDNRKFGSGWFIRVTRFLS